MKRSPLKVVPELWCSDEYVDGSFQAVQSAVLAPKSHQAGILPNGNGVL